MDIEILYEDKDIIACVKPVNVLSQADDNKRTNMIDILSEERGEIYPLHRLDKNVGGVMVYAKNKLAAAKLSTDIQNHKFDKYYMAVVHGEPENNATYKDLLFKDSKKNKSYVVKRMRKGVKEASLEFVKIATLTKDDNPGKISLVRIKLHTGRTHQIRVQFSSRKMPLLGDRRYGSDYNECEIALWSYRIELVHPSSGKKMVFEKDIENVCPFDFFNTIEAIPT